MEFRFPVNEVLKQPMVEIGQNLIPPGFSGDRRALWDTVSKVTEIVNAMGQASAAAQGLTKPITTADRLRNSDQKIYLLVDQQAGNGRGAVTGMLKTGKKGLYVFDRDGQHYQVSPPCVLDFYVHESRQRNGLGKQLFQHMLQKEEVHPVKMAIDRPSEKFLGFLNKHYSLNEPVKQMNNYVVFDGFFPGNSPQQEKSSPIENNNVSGAGRKQPFNGLQAVNYASPLGRYGAPRPPCSMGQIIHNQTSTIAATPEPTGTRSAPSTNYQQSSQYASPENVQSAPNMYYRSLEHYTQNQMSTSLHQAGDADHYQTNPALVQVSHQSEVNTSQSRLHQTAQNHQIDKVPQSDPQRESLDHAQAQTLQSQIHHSPQSQVWPGGFRTVKLEATRSVIRTGLQSDELLLQAQQHITGHNPQNHVNPPLNVEPTSQGRMQSEITPQQQMSQAEMQAEMQRQQQQQRQQEQYIHMPGTYQSNVRRTLPVEKSPSARSGLQAPPGQPNQQVSHDDDNAKATAKNNDGQKQKRATRVWPGGVHTVKVEPQQNEIIPKRMGLCSPRSESPTKDPGREAPTSADRHGPQNTQSAPQFNQNQQYYTASQPITTQPSMQTEWPSTTPSDQVQSQSDSQYETRAQELNTGHSQVETSVYMEQTSVQQSVVQPQMYQAVPQQFHAQQAITQPHVQATQQAGMQEVRGAQSQPLNNQYLGSTQRQINQTEIQPQPHLANAQHVTRNQPQPASVHSVPTQLHPQEGEAARSQPSNPQHLGSAQLQTGIQSLPNLANMQHQIQPQQTSVQSVPNLASAHGEPPQQSTHDHPDLTGVQAQQQAASSPVPVQPQVHQTEAKHSHQPITVPIDPSQYYQNSQIQSSVVSPQQAYTVTVDQPQQAADAHQMGDHVRSAEQQKQQSIAEQAESAHARQDQSANSQQMSQPETMQANQYPAANLQHQQQINQQVPSVEQQKQQQQATVQQAEGDHANQSLNPQQMAQPETQQAYQNNQQRINQEALSVESPQQHQNQTSAANVQSQHQMKQDACSVEQTQLHQQSMVQPAVVTRPGQHQSANSPQMAQPETNQASYQNRTAAADVQHRQQMNQDARFVESPQQYQQSMVQPAVVTRPGTPRQYQSANAQQMAQPEVGANVQYQQQMNQEARPVQSPQQYQEATAAAAYPGHYQSASPQQMAPPTTNVGYQKPATAPQPVREVRSRPVVKTDGISDICSQRSKHRLYSNEQAESAAPNNQGRGDMKYLAERRLDNHEYGYPPQRPQNFDNQAAPLHAVEFKIGSSPKLERPRSLSIQLSEEQTDNKNGVEVDGHEEVVEDDVEEELQKLTVEDNDVIPTKDINEAENSPTTNKKTPSHLTEQGFFDLKFYHSKLW